MRGPSVMLREDVKSGSRKSCFKIGETGGTYKFKKASSHVCWNCGDLLPPPVHLPRTCVTQGWIGESHAWTPHSLESSSLIQRHACRRNVLSCSALLGYWKSFRVLWGKCCVSIDNHIIGFDLLSPRPSPQPSQTRTSRGARAGIEPPSASEEPPRERSSQP